MAKWKDKQISAGLILSKSLYKLDLTCMQREMNPGPGWSLLSIPCVALRTKILCVVQILWLMSFWMLSFYFLQMKIYSAIYQCFQVLLPINITDTVSILSPSICHESFEWFNHLMRLRLCNSDWDLNPRSFNWDHKLGVITHLAQVLDISSLKEFSKCGPSLKARETPGYGAVSF